MPPIETLSVQRVTLPEPDMITVDVVNDGPDEITIAQVRVDDAYWKLDMEPAGTIGRLESATITIPYPWVEDEAHAISILSSTGVVFDAEVPVAIESPAADRESVARFALVGLYVGIVPIALIARSQIALITLSQLIVRPATFLSTTMMPSALMPEWVQLVARLNPMTWAVELGRGGLSGSYPAHAGLAVGGLPVLGALAFCWAVRSMRAYQRSI